MIRWGRWYRSRGVLHRVLLQRQRPGIAGGDFDHHCTRSRQAAWIPQRHAEVIQRITHPDTESIIGRRRATEDQFQAIQLDRVGDRAGAGQRHGVAAIDPQPLRPVVAQLGGGARQVARIGDRDGEGCRPGIGDMPGDVNRSRGEDMAARQPGGRDTPGVNRVELLRHTQCQLGHLPACFVEQVRGCQNAADLPPADLAADVDDATLGFDA